MRRKLVLISCWNQAASTCPYFLIVQLEQLKVWLISMTGTLLVGLSSENQNIKCKMRLNCSAICPGRDDSRRQHHPAPLAAAGQMFEESEAAAASA